MQEADLNKKRLMRMKELHDALSFGENAELVKTVMAPILIGLKADIVDSLCVHESIDPQTLSELHRELFLLTRLSAQLDNAVENGNRAKEALEKESVKRPLPHNNTSRSFQL